MPVILKSVTCSNAVYPVYMDANAGGEFWMEVENAVVGAVRKNILVTTLSKFPATGDLSEKVAALTRWRRWLENSAWHNLRPISDISAQSA